MRHDMKVTIIFLKITYFEVKAEKIIEKVK